MELTHVNNDESSSYVAPNESSNSQTNNLNRIVLVKTSVNDIRSEIHEISTALHSMIQASTSSN
ncbi:8214_t:CDS:2 [Funneliformis geosporum]|uniref:8214_t:CDS:1 n=1 Tax=Funneliformis geosporum TaxID=1117311 RepID=A0A9W4SYI2_9GLOM|nr:8214_t:CDS:2 [Funneliformis geosporum]